MSCDDEARAAVLAGLEARLGYRFRQRALLERALTRRSAAHAAAGCIVAVTTNGVVSGAKWRMTLIIILTAGDWMMYAVPSSHWRSSASCSLSQLM